MLKVVVLSSVYEHDSHSTTKHAQGLQLLDLCVPVEDLGPAHILLVWVSGLRFGQDANNNSLSCIALGTTMSQNSRDATDATPQVHGSGQNNKLIPILR